MTNFRNYTEGDRSELETMVLALYEEDGGGEEMSPEKIRRTVRELALHPHRGTIFVFCETEVVVGYAIVIYRWSNEHGGTIAVIDELYVKPPWRGRGIGTAFLRQISGGADIPLQGLQLEVTPGNQRALAYYLRQGFQSEKNRHLFKKLGEPGASELPTG